ncbi:hypothetical protein Bca4012_060573 [Brassica carinata]
MSMVSSSNVVHQPLEHQVFINFRGKELRGSFVSHLVKALKTEGINVFIDNNTRMGKDLKIFFKEIEDSCIAIAVISSLYSESRWCLNELAKIRECVNKKTLEVFPVFYKVSVDTVKNRRDMFGANFDRSVKEDHTKRKAWKRALTFVTKKKGEIVDENSDEVQVINKIVNDVKIKLEEVRREKGTKSPRENISEVSKGGEPMSSSAQTSPFIGITTRLQQLEEKLDFELDEATRVIGVVGMPGIGKTTLAKKLLEKWGPEFLNIMFLDDIRKKSKSPGFDKLHKDLLHGLIRSAQDGKENKDIEVSLESLKAKLSKSKVFIVLDDVSEKEMVDETYLVSGLSDEDGFKYFEKHAFSGSCEPSFKKLAKEFVDYSRGHPLALKELGRELLGKDKAYWESKLETLAKSPISNTIQDVLRTPYDDLSKHHKDLFLDVARFFRFEDGYHVRSLLDSSVHENVSEIRNLADKFLINICGGRLEVNDLMYTFAMGLESQPSSENSTSGRRLFNHRDIITILRNNEEATKIRGMFLDMSEIPKKISLGSDTFKEMNDLRYLKFFDSSCTKDSEAKCNLNFPNGLDFTLQEIRNSFRSLPKNISFLYNLKWLDLKYCEQLISLPVLPPSLHWLDAHGCVALEDIESPMALILAETEHSHSTFAFTNCTKLDQVAKNGIISYVWRKIQLMSDALAHQEKVLHH